MMINIKDKINNITNLISNNKFVDASIQIDEIIKENKDIDLIYNLKGIVLQKQKKFDKSIDSFKKAIKINSSYLSAYNNLGIVYQSIQENEKAISCFKKMISINKNLHIKILPGVTNTILTVQLISIQGFPDSTKQQKDAKPAHKHSHN